MVCLQLAGLGLNGNADSLAILRDLQSLAYLNLEYNRLYGELQCALREAATCHQPAEYIHSSRTKFNKAFKIDHN